MIELDWTRNLAGELSSDRLIELTRRISGEVRLSGSDEERRALDFVRSTLDGAGLETELLVHDAYISLPGAAEIQVGDDRFPCITHSFSATSGAGGVSGDLISLDAPADAPVHDLRGKIALLDGLAMAGYVSLVESAGAIGQIYINGELTHEMIVSAVWGSPGLADRSRYPKGVVVSVTKEIGHRLRERLRSGQTTVRVRGEVDTRWRKTPLLLGHLRAAASDDFVLLSGHIDSWHLGAMDNAGANAAMCEAARILARHKDKLQRGLRVAFWSGHSHGRYSGSAWYADTYWRDLRDHCVAHVNVDSIGGMGATILSEGVAMASTKALGAAAIDQISRAGFEGTRVGRAGDQSFVALGVPSLWMSVSEQPPSDHPTARAFASAVGSPRSGGLGWWWHTVEDTMDKLDPELLLRDTQIYVMALGRLAGEALLPFSGDAEAGELVNRLKDLQSAADGKFDLSSTIVAADAAVAVGERLERWRRAQPAAVGSSNARRFNRALVALLQGLVVANYSAYGPYGQDPAAGMRPLPLLAPVRELADLDPDSDEAHSMMVDLVRARNRVEDLILQGTETAEQALVQLR